MKFQPPPPWDRNDVTLWANEVVKYLVPGKISDRAFLPATFDLVAADDTFEDTGLAITLPEIGFYNISTIIHAHLDVQNGTGSLTAALYDTSIVANSEMKIAAVVGPHLEHFGSGNSIGYTSTIKNQVLKLYMKSTGGANWNDKYIESDEDGRTTLEYFYYGRLREVE